MAYIHPRVSFEDLEALIFSTLNVDKSSRLKAKYDLLPNFQVENLNEVSKVVMVFPR